MSCGRAKGALGALKPPVCVEFRECCSITTLTFARLYPHFFAALASELFSIMSDFNAIAKQFTGQCLASLPAQPRRKHRLKQELLNPFR